METSTALCVAAFQVPSTHTNRLATLTTTVPLRPRDLIARDHADDSQPSKGTPDQVFCMTSGTALPAVICLLLSCCPVAVLRRVVVVIVSTFQCMSMRGLWSHVLFEHRKRPYPRWVNFDPPSSVVHIVRGLWIQAARFHIAPCSVHGRTSCSCRVSVRLVPVWFSHRNRIA